MTVHLVYYLIQSNRALTLGNSRIHAQIVTHVYALS